MTNKKIYANLYPLKEIFYTWIQSLDYLLRVEPKMSQKDSENKKKINEFRSYSIILLLFINIALFAQKYIL